MQQLGEDHSGSVTDLDLIWDTKDLETESYRQALFSYLMSLSLNSCEVPRNVCRCLTHTFTNLASSICLFPEMCWASWQQLTAHHFGAAPCGCPGTAWTKEARISNTPFATRREQTDSKAGTDWMVQERPHYALILALQYDIQRKKINSWLQIVQPDET